MSTPTIRAALESILATFATAQGLPVAWENKSFTAPAGPYLRAFLIPGATGSDDMGRAHRKYQGVWQVSLVMPEGDGPGPGEALAAQVIALYPPATPIVRDNLAIHVLQPMSQAAPLPEPGRRVIPLSLLYRADSY